jgi:hypothetical protein
MSSSSPSMVIIPLPLISSGSSVIRLQINFGLKVPVVLARRRQPGCAIGCHQTCVLRDQRRPSIGRSGFAQRATAMLVK